MFQKKTWNDKKLNRPATNLLPSLLLKSEIIMYQGHMGNTFARKIPFFF